MPRRIIRNAIYLPTLPRVVAAAVKPDKPAKAAPRKRAKKPKITPELYRLLPGETSEQRAARLREFFTLELRAAGLGAWEPEYKFALASHRRKWAFDLCWRDARVAVEIEGRGAHQRSRYWTDMEKYNRAAVMGYLLIRVSYEMIADGTALALVEDAFALRQAVSA